MELEPDPLASAPRRVEAYLDQILAPLTHRLSPFQRDELRRELREHLRARVEAYRELGQPEDEAVTEALRQFGGAEDFLRQWHREWMKTTPKVTLREAWKAAWPALRPSLAGIAIAFLPFIVIHVCWLNLQGSTAGALLYRCGHTLIWSWIWFAFLLMPIRVGMQQGWRIPKQAGVGMLTALTAAFLITRLLYEVAAWALPYEVWASPVGSYVQMDSDSLFALMAAWISIAAGAATVSGWWAQRRKRVLA